MFRGIKIPKGTCCLNWQAREKEDYIEILQVATGDTRMMPCVRYLADGLLVKSTWPNPKIGPTRLSTLTMNILT